jgi:SAM-dependent methyltransferase
VTEQDRDRAQVEPLWVAPDGDAPPQLENHLGGEAARNYRRFEFDLVAPHVGRSLLEVGSGLGDFAEQFVDRVDRLVVSDGDPYCVEHLGKRFADRAKVEVIDFLLPAEVPLAEPVDTVVAMNVLEHVVEDVDAVRGLARVVVPGGRIVLWVPGYMQLYGDFDRKVGHVTRYTPKTLRETVTKAGLDIEVLKPVNLLGGIAWWAAVRFAGVGTPRPSIVRIYDRLVVPTTRFIERLMVPPFGQTVFCVARVPG